jgi:hypothetical protein
MVQNKNNIVKPLHIADIALTAYAAVSGEANIVKKRPNNWNVGAPGG